MTDYACAVFLIFVKELSSARESNLVDELVDLLGCHTDTLIAHSECTCFWIDSNIDFQIVGVALKLSCTSKSLELLCSIDSIAYKLTKENLVVAVKKLLDHREDVLGGYID